MEFVQNLLSFIVAIGILVTVHEYGHFWVARKMGVRVLRFSVGFGRPLFKRNGKDGTEYVIAAVPLGGYVRMLGEQDDEITDENRHQAFNHKSLRAKAAIVVAGPMANFIFAIFAYWLMFVVGIPGQIPQIGEIIEQSTADRASMRANEVILRVNGNSTPTWSVTNSELLDAVLSDDQINIETRTQGHTVRQYRLIVDNQTVLLDDNGLLQNLGIKAWQPPVWIGEVTPDSAAEQAGLRHGDRVLAVDGQPVKYWSDWVSYISARPDTPIEVEIRRDGVMQLVQVTPRAIINEDGKLIGRIGVGRFIPEEVRQQHLSEVKYDPVPAFGHALIKTWEFSALTVRMLGRMIIGQASHKNISGPITIAQYAGLAASLGWLEYVRILAIISISLGVLNLLPIPMLDGGHLLYYVIESVRGGPLSDQAYAIGQQVGIIFLLLLMSLAFYNDFSRLLG
ncbi:MAG: RIP metalloprotease RseP [Gammaproteobacteria bacterium]|nr:RIP metalloprotease RseP [Gammaproteobacteria bacterium]